MSNFIFSTANTVKNDVRDAIDKKTLFFAIQILAFTVGLALAFVFKPTVFISEYLTENAENYYCAVMYADTGIFSIFFNRVVVNFGYFIIITGIGFVSFLFPLSTLIIAYRGYILGLTVCIFYSTFGLTGILIAVFMIMPQNIITTLAMILLSGMALYLKKNRPFFKAYLLYALLIYTVSLIGALIEIIILGLLLRPMNFYF